MPDECDKADCFGARNEAYPKCETCEHIGKCSTLTLMLNFPGCW